MSDVREALKAVKESLALLKANMPSGPAKDSALGYFVGVEQKIDQALSTPPADVTLRGALQVMAEFLLELGHCKLDERGCEACGKVNLWLRQAKARQPKVLAEYVVTVRCAEQIAMVHPAFRDLRQALVHMKLDDEVRVIVVEHGD